MGFNVIVGQSGGPTAVINASLAGIFQNAIRRGADHVYGMCNGIQGFLEERMVDMGTVIRSNLDFEILKRTPSSFLGSCRYRLPQPQEDDAPFRKIFDLLIFDDLMKFMNHYHAPARRQYR